MAWRWFPCYWKSLATKNNIVEGFGLSGAINAFSWRDGWNGVAIEGGWKGLKRAGCFSVIGECKCFCFFKSPKRQKLLVDTCPTHTFYVQF